MSQLSQEESKAQEEGHQLKELVSSRAYQEVFLPWLQSKINHQWVDPRDFKSQDEFVRAYNISWGFAKACTEIQEWLESRISEAEMLTKKEKGELKDNL